MKTGLDIHKPGRDACDASKAFRAEIRESLRCGLLSASRALGDNITIADMVTALAMARLRAAGGVAGRAIGVSRCSEIGREEMERTLGLLQFGSPAKREIANLVTSELLRLRRCAKGDADSNKT